MHRFATLARDIKLSHTVFAMPWALLATFLAADGLPRYRALLAKSEEVRRENERLRREVRSLRREVEALKRDPRAVERIARDELGMLREGELIFQFPE